eukprot:TRINITY_DN8551_c0_g1_i1.p2 TRINITY_DN8551_c0_g1~~TRINITY_DN8551_c0_g1_i1.p2  ORF type:complete len:256 (+),score=77.52 TRINITY_DN8551_c0_g1_i1:36-803(+)
MTAAQMMYRVEQATRGSSMSRALKSDPRLSTYRGSGRVTNETRGRTRYSPSGGARAHSTAPYERQPGSSSHAQQPQHHRSASTLMSAAKHIARLRETGSTTAMNHVAGAASTASQQGDVDYLMDRRLEGAVGTTEPPNTQVTVTSRRMPTKFAKIARLPAGFEDATEMLQMVAKRRPMKPLNGTLLNVRDPTPADGPSILDRRFMTRAYRERNPAPSPSQVHATEKKYRTGHSVWGLKRRRQPDPAPPRAKSNRR